MAQWTNIQRIKKFVNRTKLYITCEKSGGLHPVEPGLTASRRAGRQAGGRLGRQEGRQTKFGQGLTFEKLAVDLNIQFFALFNQGTASVHHF